MIEIDIHKELNGSDGLMDLDISMSVESGSFIAITGKSGSGKSTILSLIASLSKPTSGEVIVDNQRMLDFTQVGNTLTIPCIAGTEKIEIHGSWAIPEFGVIAAMILAVAIISIIVVTAKTRLSIVPRY